MVKLTLAVAALIVLAGGCGDSEHRGADNSGTTAVAVGAEVPSPSLQLTGNRVPEEPWWQADHADPEAPEPTPPEEETFEISGDLLFDESSSELGPAAASQLQHLVDELADDPNATLEIIGHTDNTPGPTPDYNDALSQARADAVGDWVVASGIDVRRTSTEGRADREPVTANDTEPGRALNRRVTITIRRTR